MAQASAGKDLWGDFKASEYFPVAILLIIFIMLISTSSILNDLTNLVFWVSVNIIYILVFIFAAIGIGSYLNLKNKKNLRQVLEVGGVAIAGIVIILVMPYFLAFFTPNNMAATLQTTYTAAGVQATVLISIIPHALIGNIPITFNIGWGYAYYLDVRVYCNGQIKSAASEHINTNELGSEGTITQNITIGGLPSSTIDCYALSYLSGPSGVIGNEVNTSL